MTASFLLSTANCYTLTVNYLKPHRVLHTAYCLLLTAYCLLPTAYCQLLTAHCLLLTAYCLLLTVRCLWVTLLRARAARPGLA
jgi:hypothetical protein